MATIIADRHRRPGAHPAAVNEPGVVEQTGQAAARVDVVASFTRVGLQPA